MKIINLTRLHPYIRYNNISFIIKFNNINEIWLFNCHQGCQHTFINKRIKINQISKIIISDLNSNNICGLLGLLSSLSLIQRNKSLHIYCPSGLDKYIKLGKKYSQTNFHYNLYLHILRTGLIINSNSCQIYSFINKSKFEFIITNKEQKGRFKLNKAKNFNLMIGPLYGKLKKGSKFLLPDGYILDGNYFTSVNNKGMRTSCLSNKYNKRHSIETSNRSQII